jgi:hypothetical protein
MKLHIFKYFWLFGILLTVASCINQNYGIQAPQLNAVSNLQYTLNGDSVKLSWTLPKASSTLSVSIMYNGGTILVSGNPTSYTFGVVQTNVDYMFTVKAQDTNGNLSLGQTVKFNRSGAMPVTNLSAAQNGSNSVLLSWTLPSETLSSLTLKYGSTTVTLPGTTTSYQVNNVAVGTYLFGIVDTDNQNQISNTVYLQFKVGPTVVAFLGTDPDSLSISNHEQAAAAKWLFANYPAARYVPFSEIKNGTVNLSQFDVIWWDYDITTGSALPAIATDPTVLTSIQSYYQNGGKLLCSAFAINYLWNLGRLPSALQANVENDIGVGSYNPDIWTVNVDIDGKQDNSTHPLFKGLTLTTQGDGEKTFPVIGAGWKENHNCVLTQIPAFFGLPNNNDAAYSDFCNTYTAKWLGGWGGISDYFMAGIFELDPTSSFKGTAIAIGIGGIEWDQLGASPGAISGTEGFTNPYQANIVTLYTNALSYLKSK